MRTSLSTIRPSLSSRSYISESRNSGSPINTLSGTNCSMGVRKSYRSSSKQTAVKTGDKGLRNLYLNPNLSQFSQGLRMNSANGDQRKRISQSQKRSSVYQGSWRVGGKLLSRVLPDFGNACIPKRGFGIQFLPSTMEDYTRNTVRNFVKPVRERLEQRVVRQLQQRQRELEQREQQAICASCSPALLLQLSL